MLKLVSFKAKPAEIYAFSGKIFIFVGYALV